MGSVQEMVPAGLAEALRNGFNPLHDVTLRLRITSHNRPASLTQPARAAPSRTVRLNHTPPDAAPLPPHRRPPRNRCRSCTAHRRASHARQSYSHAAGDERRTAVTRSSTNIDLEGSKGGAAHDDADDVYYYLICLSCQVPPQAVRRAGDQRALLHCMPFTSYTGPAPLEQAHLSWADVYNLFETLTERKPRLGFPAAARRLASYAV